MTLYRSGALVVTAPGKRPRVFDPRGALASLGGGRFEIHFAQMVSGALVVSFAINGYAKDVAGKTGYLAAFDAASGRLLWSSAPLTSSMSDFVVAGRSILAGYGFTAEPDFLYVLDATTGAATQKIALKSQPEMLVPRGDRLFVRAYDTDYVFKSAAPLPAAPPAVLAPLADAPPAARPDLRCWTLAAAAAIDARDTRALRVAIDALAGDDEDTSLARALDETRAFLRAQETAPRRIDLSTVDPVALAAPPWRRAVLAPSAAPPRGSPPRLVRTSHVKRTDWRPEPVEFNPQYPTRIAPVRRGALPPRAPADIPSSYGMEDLHAILPYGGRTALVYGGRYVALVNDDRSTERVFDLDAFRHPPDPDPEWKEFAVEDVTDAKVDGGVVYVCNGGGSYAREVRRKKGFLSAIELATGKLLWRSEPLVCGSNVLVDGDWLVSGYGFTAEPDFVFVLRKSDGAVVSRTPVDSAPGDMLLSGVRLHVPTYGATNDFDLR